MKWSLVLPSSAFPTSSSHDFHSFSSSSSCGADVSPSSSSSSSVSEEIKDLSSSSSYSWSFSSQIRKSASSFANKWIPLVAGIIVVAASRVQGVALRTFAIGAVAIIETGCIKCSSCNRPARGIVIVRGPCWWLCIPYREEIQCLTTIHIHNLGKVVAIDRTL